MLIEHFKIVRNNFVIRLVILIATVSCTYAPEEKFFLEVERTIPQSSVSLNNFNDRDTVFIFESTSFQYSVSAANVTISGTEVLLGSTTLVKTPNTSGFFSLSESNLKSGIYELKIQFTSNSGTGSLADRFGTESIQIWKKWILVIDVDIPAVPTLTATNENGFLKITWTKYEKRNFSNYKFYINQFERFTITDPSKNFFIDSTYIGPLVLNFMVVVNTNLHSSASNVVTVNEPQSVQFSYSSQDTTVTLKWKKTRFENAFKELVIMENNTIRETIINPIDTIAILKLKEVYFGSTPAISLKIYPKYPAQDSQPFEFTEYITNPLGLPMTEANQRFYYNKILDALMGYSSRDGWLRTYNSSIKTVDSIRLGSNFSMPYPGNHIYYPVTRGIGQYNIITKQLKTIQTEGHYSGFYTPYFLVGANNDLVIYSLHDTTYPWDVRVITRIVNINSGEKTTLSNAWYDPRNYDSSAGGISGNIGSRVLSDDGRHVKFAHQMYTVSGVDLIMGIYFPGVQEFRPDNSEEIISKFSPTDINKASDAALLRTISPPELGCTLVNYDPATKNILYSKYSENKAYLINIETLETTTIRASDVTALMNGILFDGRGHYLKVF